MLFHRMTETISGVSRRLTRAGLALALLASGVTAALPAGAFLELPEIEITPSEDGNYADNHPACGVADWRAISDEQIRIWAVQLNSEGRLNAAICQPFGETLLHLVVESASVETVDWLLTQGTRLDVTTIDKCTPLCRALFWGRSDIAKRFYQIGGMPENDELGSPLQRALVFAPPERIRPFLRFLREQGYQFAPMHMTLALQNGRAEMALNLIELGVRPDIIIPTFFDGQPTKLSAFEYAVFRSPDSEILMHFWELGVTPNLSGQLGNDEILSLDDLVEARLVFFEYAKEASYLLLENIHNEFDYQKCVERDFGTLSFCNLARGLSTTGGRSGYWQEFLRRSLEGIASPISENDESWEYLRSAQEIIAREGLIDGTQTRS